MNEDRLPSVGWTEAETDALLKLWASGKTATYIVGKLCMTFGTMRTRNAVIGKIHRLQGKGVAITKRPSPIKHKAALELEPQLTEPQTIYAQANTCAEPGCNAFPLPRKSYCEHHAARYFVKPNK